MLPAMGTLSASLRVTVIVEAATPFDATEPGLDVTVEVPAFVTGVVKVTAAVWVMTTLSVVTVAV